MNYKLLKRLLIVLLLILVSSSTYSQRIRTIGNDTFVTFTREQAKAVNDTFYVQKQTIKTLKQQDSLNTAKEIHRKKQDSITYYQQIIPALNELKGLLVAQIETPFKPNFEVGAGVGLSTYFGEYRSFNKIIDGAFYMPAGSAVLKYNYHKHLSTRFEFFSTRASAPPLNESILSGAILVDYNFAPNMYSVRVGMIPVVSVGYNIFGLPNEMLLVGSGVKGYFTSNTAIEISIRYTLTDLDEIGKSDHFIWGYLTITRKIK